MCKEKWKDGVGRMRMRSNITWSCQATGRKQEEDNGAIEKRTSWPVDVKKIGRCVQKRRKGGSPGSVLRESGRGQREARVSLY
jgi:hypothetical protein